MNHKIKIKLYGERAEIESDGLDSVLVSALSNGMNPPFSCQIGACGHCRAILIDGEVKMDECDALTDKEISEGYVLTCQAKPITENISIDYDY